MSNKSRSLGEEGGYEGLQKAQCLAKAHALTLDIYRITKRFPKEEMYGLTSQMRRASSSIAANIAEGCGRKTAGEFARFLVIASGSASELEYHLLLSHDLEMMEDSDYDRLTSSVIEVKKMLTSLTDVTQKAFLFICRR